MRYAGGLSRYNILWRGFFKLQRIKNTNKCVRPENENKARECPAIAFSFYAICKKSKLVCRKNLGQIEIYTEIADPAVNRSSVQPTQQAGIIYQINLSI